ncbi:MAG: S-adenosylmethionine:tRNA ribosyltransferase-isomerase [Acidimicrobiales bacterium]
MEVPDYPLPESAIAQHPAEERDAARLLVSIDPRRPPAHRLVADLAELVGPGDVVVVNNSRVLAARLPLRKRSGAAAEVLLLEADPPGQEDSWIALVRPGRRLAPGTVLLAGGEPAVEVGETVEGPGGRRRVRLASLDVIKQVGIVPLPPYIHEPLEDPERYQTVYARKPASAAAPTAGLHLTAGLLEACRRRGALVMELDLAVGLATFAPISASRVEDHVMHVERYEVPERTWEACAEARRVVAIGTTTVRALESAAATGELAGGSDLYIRGDYPFAVVDVMMTNFHQPRSSLLVLLEAFCGPRWRDLYAAALAEGYRFLSFGDAMIVGRQDVGERVERA